MLSYNDPVCPHFVALISGMTYLGSGESGMLRKCNRGGAAGLASCLAQSTVMHAGHPTSACHWSKAHKKIAHLTPQYYTMEENPRKTKSDVAKQH